MFFPLQNIRQYRLHNVAKIKNISPKKSKNIKD